LSKDNGLPLHKTAHFRRLREVILEIAKYEKIDISQFDPMNIKAYYAYGQSLKGHNVSYNTKDNFSTWVLDNHYEFYEIPAITNIKNSIYGKYLFFAYNVDFKYYVFGTMTVELNKAGSISAKHLIEKVYFISYGRYEITFLDTKNSILKTDYGTDFTPGNQSTEHTFAFDSFSERKTAYKTDSYKILSSLDKGLAKQVNQNKISGNTTVKIYNKTNNNVKRPNHNIVGSGPKSKKK